MFRKWSVFAWFTVFLLLIYVVVCFGVITFVEIPVFHGEEGIRIGADSGAYYALAKENLGQDVKGQEILSFTGNLLGPLILIKILQHPVPIGFFNVFLLAVMIWSAGKVPGARRSIFILLLLMNGMMLANITTLNKEILAGTGIVLFAQYVYARKWRGLLLTASLALSLMARWEQVAIILLFTFFESSHSPVRGRPWRGIVLLVVFISLVYPVLLLLSPVSVSGFLSQVEGAHLILLLDNIQAKGGFAIAVIPKVLMGMLGHLATPGYFRTEWFEIDAFDLQQRYIGNLNNLAMTVLLGYAYFAGYLRMRRPLPYFAVLYLIATAVNPFVQSRYQFPVYVLIALELARSKQSLEAVPARWRPPALPRSYLIASKAAPPR